MPVRRQGQLSRSKFALSDSDSEEEICLTLARYQEAEFGVALHTRQVSWGPSGSKLLERDRKAVGWLLEAVKQRLPQSRVRKAQQDYKKRFVSLSRKDRPSDIAEEDAEGDDTVLGELPLEVLQHMFTLLDPVTLGVASCVCSTWHSLSQDESLWQRCLAQVTLVNSSSSSSRQHTRSATSRQLFNAVAARSPKVLELFRSNRVLKAGRLHWALPDCTPHSARRVFSDSPLTVQMVVQHMLGIPATHMRDPAAVESDSDEEELTNRINRLWRPTVQPLVKSYSHASM
ncbi:hypothetical protein ABBQ38_013292 [Trebouxia sp. C0009 RCD-2024]